MQHVRLLSFSLACSLFFCTPTLAQEANLPDVPAKSTENDKTLLNDVELIRKDFAPLQKQPAMSPLHSRFKKLLTGAKLTGQFTVDGKPLGDLHAETYEIEKVEKMEEGDQWVITARIKYGKHNVLLPVPIEVKWAGRTPVLTLDNMTLPGLGTFGARVVFHQDKYAGTWQHDDVGGHMFGKIDLGGKSSENSRAAD